jgi:predicted DNA-binding protein YlxM (UPF0122 family)
VFGVCVGIGDLCMVVGVLMAKRERDWEKIRMQVRADRLSIKEIARQHGISDAAIHQKRRRDEKNGISWKKNLSKKIRDRINEEVSANVSANDMNDEEIIESAAAIGIALIRDHRNDIKKLRELETKLIDELSNKPTKLYIAQYKGDIIEKELDITATERAAAANNLANVQHKRIQLERQAYNLDEPEESGEITIKVEYGEKKHLGPDVSETEPTENG